MVGTLLAFLSVVAFAGDVSAIGGFTSAPVAPAYAPVDGSNPLLQVGGWTEAVPLELPPGRGGAPAIGLTADFHIPDGPMGPGWRLDGFSRVDRQSKTGGVPRLGPSDVFLLDGVQLYADGAGTYKTERDDGRVISRDLVQNRWIVRKDGWTWTYGESFGSGTGIATCAVEWQTESANSCELFPGSALTRGSETTAWLLAAVEDPHGNVTSYQYMVPDEDVAAGADTDLGGDHAYAHLPSSVSYGPTVVNFQWEARSDRRSDARSGRMRTTAARLSGIEVEANGDPDFAAAYAVLYLDNDTAGCPGEAWPYPQAELASVVHRVERLGTDGGSKTLRCLETDASETTFAAWSSPLGSGPEWESTAEDLRYTMMMVSDGDQYPDLVAVSGPSRPGDIAGAHRLVFMERASAEGDPPVTTPVDVVAWRNDQGVLAADTSLADWLTDVLDVLGSDGAWNVTDLDRDGASDVLWAADSSDAVAVSPLGSGVFDDPLAITGTDLTYGKIGDIDGDGFPDLLDSEGTWVRNTGSAPWLDSSTALAADWSWADVVDFDAECGEDNVPWGEPADPGVAHPVDDAEWMLTQLVDVNGDGLADLVFSGSPCWHLEGDDLLLDAADPVRAVLLGDGQGVFSPAGYTAGGSSITSWNEQFNMETDTYPMATSQWTTTDMDRSGRVQVLNGSSFYPDLGLPSGFGFDAWSDEAADPVGNLDNSLPVAP